jgi:hypothetical protein
LLFIVYLFPQTNKILLDLADSVLFISPLDSYVTFAMFFPTCKLFNKPSNPLRGSPRNPNGFPQGKDGKLKVSMTPLVIYSYEDKQLAIKENKGKSGVYRWVNTLTGDTYVGSAVSLSKRFSVYYSTKSINEVLSRSPSRDPLSTSGVDLKVIY